MKSVSGTSLGENVSGREIVSGKAGLEEMVPGKRSQGDSRGFRERGDRGKCLRERGSHGDGLGERVSGRTSQRNCLGDKISRRAALSESVSERNA